MKKSLLFITIFLLSLATAQALSMSIPPNREFTFEPNKIITVDFAAQNSDGVPQHVQIFANGELAEYITFEPSGEIYLEAGDILPFKAIISLPETLEPGTHIPKIGVKGIPKGEQAMIGATTAVQVRVFIRGRHDGEYVKTVLDVPPQTIGEDITIRATHHNLGTQDVTDVVTKVDVYNNKGTQMGTLMLDSVDVKKDKRKVVTKKFSTNGFKRGFYDVNATVMINGKVQEEKPHTQVRLGEQEVSITGHTSRLERGDLRPFQINVTNEWNEPIKFVYVKAEMSKGDRLGKTEFTTPAVTIGPFQTIPVQGYFDLNNASLGSNVVEARLHYSVHDKTKEESLPVIVVKEGQIEKPAANYDMMTILIAIIILLIVMNIFWFAYVQHVVKKK